MNLNIRQKVGLVFAASIVVIALIAGYSYYYLKAIELKQHVVEVANDLRENILEIRRYEKNYLLYGSPEDWQENVRQTDLALKTLAQILPEGSNLKIAKDLKSLETELTAYQAPDAADSHRTGPAAGECGTGRRDAGEGQTAGGAVGSAGGV